MEFEQTHIEGVVLIKPRVFGDHRGYFYESYREDLYKQVGIKGHFVQDNQSMSNKGILRGLHFQAPPHAQGKLVRVVKGAVLDVIVDIRSGSNTYGEHYSVELNETNKFQLWVPPGFAHGFLTLEDRTIFSYKCTDYYNHASEGAVYWSSPELGIDWGISDPILSEKDNVATHFSEFKSPF